MVENDVVLNINRRSAVIILRKILKKNWRKKDFTPFLYTKTSVIDSSTRFLHLL